MSEIILKSTKVTETVTKLEKRIHDRFPDSNLYQICKQLHQFAVQTEGTILKIKRPNILIRCLSLLAICGLIATITSVFISLRGVDKLSVTEFIQTSEAGANLLIFLSISFYFLWTLELKIKRSKAIGALNKLRDLAHIIDMHQLTKDPDGIAKGAIITPNSPKREMSAYELGRYLDYCSEMLSIISKLGYLYIARFQDPIATKSSNDLETLTTGLSRKIWQKIIILRSTKPENK